MVQCEPVETGCPVTRSNTKKNETINLSETPVSDSEALEEDLLDYETHETQLYMFDAETGLSYFAY